MKVRRGKKQLVDIDSLKGDELDMALAEAMLDFQAKNELALLDRCARTSHPLVPGSCPSSPLMPCAAAVGWLAALQYESCMPLQPCAAQLVKGIQQRRATAACLSSQPRQAACWQHSVQQSAPGSSSCWPPA